MFREKVFFFWKRCELILFCLFGEKKLEQSFILTEMSAGNLYFSNAGQSLLFTFARISLSLSLSQCPICWDTGSHRKSISRYTVNRKLKQKWKNANEILVYTFRQIHKVINTFVLNGIQKFLIFQRLKKNVEDY